MTPTPLAAAIDENTVAVLLEPIQGEAGIIVPPDDYLPRVRALCTERNVLMIADEIQSGLARTGRTFACDHWGVVPDVYLLGKALGGGVVPLSAVVADRDVLGVLHPGEHGSTFGGNPLAAAIGTTVVAMLQRGEFQSRSAELGEHLHARLRGLIGHGVLAVRGMGLWAGVDIDPRLGTGKQVSLRLAERGVLVKDTHGSTLRFAPPLVITEEEIDWAVDQFAAVLADGVTVRTHSHRLTPAQEAPWHHPPTVSLTEQMLRRRPIIGAPVAHGASQDLKRTIGVFQLTMFGVGATVGTGIFFVLSRGGARGRARRAPVVRARRYRSRPGRHLLRRNGLGRTGFRVDVLLRLHHARRVRRDGRGGLPAAGVRGVHRRGRRRVEPVPQQAAAQPLRTSACRTRSRRHRGTTTPASSTCPPSCSS